MITILATVFVLGVLIFVHELGHFAVAKWVGIGVPRFSIGLGPKIFSVQKGETEYRLAWIPFGGYVKMAGDMSAEAVEGDDAGEEFPPEKQFDRKPVWARLLVVSAGSIMNFVWAILVFTLVFYTSGLQSIPSTKVDKVVWPGGGTPEGLEKLLPGSIVKSVDGKSVSTWDEFIETVIEGEGALELSCVDSSGDQCEITLSASDSLRQIIAVSVSPFIEPEVGVVTSGGPADEAGIRQGDRFVIIKKDTTEHMIHRWMDAVAVIHGSPEVELTMMMQRGDSSYTVQVMPARQQIPDTETSMKEVGLIGITQVSVSRPLPLIESFVEGIDRSFFLAGYILDLLGKLISRDISPRLVGGPILVGQMAGESAKQGFSVLLSFMALFSVNLAVLNMLPVPVLDGGHVVFLLIEVVWRRPLSVEQRARVSQIGFFLLIGIMVLVTYNDILRLLGF